MHTHICPIYLYDWTLNDLASYHNKVHLTEQSFSVAGQPPCRKNVLTDIFAVDVTLQNTWVVLYIWIHHILAAYSTPKKKHNTYKISEKIE